MELPPKEDLHDRKTQLLENERNRTKTLDTMYDSVQCLKGNQERFLSMITSLKENHESFLRMFGKLTERYEKVTDMLEDIKEILKLHQEAINALHRENQLLRDELTQPDETNSTERNTNED